MENSQKISTGQYIGVRQGCILSPIFTYDLSDEIRQFNSVMLGSRKIPGLMFADDLVLVADNPHTKSSECTTWVQLKMGSFCQSWQNKSSGFGMIAIPSNITWTYNGTLLQQVSSCHYLGVVLSNTRSFTTALITLCQSALKVLNMIQTMSREHGGFRPDVICSLYAVMVQPVLNMVVKYIWGPLEIL